MEETIPSIVWPAIPVIIALAVAGTVFILQKLKMLLYVEFNWSKAIPGWVWLVLSIAIPFGLVYLLSQHFAYSWLNQFLPDNMQLYIPPEAMFPTALGAIFGSGGSYGVAKKLGLAADYSPAVIVPEPGGESTVTAEENSQAALVQPSLPPPVPAPVAPGPDPGLANSEVVYLLNQCDTDPAIGPHFALVEGRLYRVEHGKMTHLPNGWNTPT